MRWRDLADDVLRYLYADGHQPTAQEIFDAYPFGMRAYTPYKIWLEQVKWWAAGCPQKPKGQQIITPLPGQEALL